MANARRPHMEAHFAAGYDWLAANGVNEWLPEQPVIEIDRPAGTLRYTAYQWSGPRGWDAEHLRLIGDDVAREWRTVPLVVPPDDKTIAALKNFGATVTGA